MNLVDVVIVVAALAYAVQGYRLGLVRGLSSTLGLVAGAVAGVKLVPLLLGRFDPSRETSVAALVVVAACALVGHVVGIALGQLLRRQIRSRPAAHAEAVGGAVLGGVGLIGVAWLLGIAITAAQLQPLDRAVRHSAVLRGVDDVMPVDAATVMRAFTRLVDASGFPVYLAPFSRESIIEVPEPTPAVARRPGVRRAGESVVKVLGNAEACGHGVEGSGFAYAPGRVMTNAHVVAGVEDILVETADGRTEDATVVAYDPDLDVAVLQVPDLGVAPLTFAQEDGESGDPAAVLGYPLNGPYDVKPARIRDRADVGNLSISDGDRVTRDVYSVFAEVRSGNSGGPLVTRRGRVLGVVYAASLTNRRTGYALTADQVEDAAREGRSATAEVPTGSCLP